MYSHITQTSYTEYEDMKCKNTILIRALIFDVNDAQKVSRQVVNR